MVETWDGAVPPGGDDAELVERVAQVLARQGNVPWGVASKDIWRNHAREVISEVRAADRRGSPWASGV